MDNLSQGLEVMILGMGTVFFALVGLFLVTSLMSRLINHKPAKAVPREPVVDEKEIVLEEPQEEELLLVPVITAAIAATLKTSPQKIGILNIRTLDSGRQWNHFGRQVNISRNRTMIKG